MAPAERLTHRSLGYRVRDARDQKDWSQEKLSEQLGFKDRQTISDIETGKRSLRPEEIVRISELLDVPVEDLLDPFSVVGEANYSWRASKEIGDEALREFENQMSRVVGLLRWMRNKDSIKANPLKQSLKVDKTATFELAQERAEQLGKTLELGMIPAELLVERIENRLDIPILFIDVDHSNASDQISGATCHLHDLGVILVNRNESPGRRNFDIAHELFHALTWDSIPPDHRESNRRVEHLADNFAAALLMPVESLKRLIDTNGMQDPIHLAEVASKLLVSPIALSYRLLNLNWIPKETQEALGGQCERYETPSRPLQYSQAFTKMLHTSIGRGRLSARKAAKALGTNLTSLARHFEGYEMSTPFDI